MIHPRLTPVSCCSLAQTARCFILAPFLFDRVPWHGTRKEEWKYESIYYDWAEHQGLVTPLALSMVRDAGATLRTLMRPAVISGLLRPAFSRTVPMQATEEICNLRARQLSEFAADVSGMMEEYFDAFIVRPAPNRSCRWHPTAAAGGTKVFSAQYGCL